MLFALLECPFVDLPELHLQWDDAKSESQAWNLLQGKDSRPERENQCGDSVGKGDKVAGMGEGKKFCSAQTGHQSGLHQTGDVERGFRFRNQVSSSAKLAYRKGSPQQIHLSTGRQRAQMELGRAGRMDADASS